MQSDFFFKLKHSINGLSPTIFTSPFDYPQNGLGVEKTHPPFIGREVSCPTINILVDHWYLVLDNLLPPSSSHRATEL